MAKLTARAGFRYAVWLWADLQLGIQPFSSLTSELLVDPVRIPRIDPLAAL